MTPPSEIGFVFTFVDLWRAKRAARHLLDLVLIFFTFGLYLKLYLAEYLVHFYYLKKGKYEPFDENTDTEIWSPLLQ